jgi:phage terminase large subunit-like protein
MAKSRGQKNINWIEKFCRIPEGPSIGAPVKLRTWQRNEIKKIYDNPAGTRRAIISFGRKNAKSTLAAFLLLLHLCGREHAKNGQLFSSAQSREQAALIFALAAKIARLSGDLRQIVVIKETAKELICPELGTRYRALSADASTAYGLNPIFMVHDELGQVRGPASRLYDALETATGSQDDPLSVIISTQAPQDGDLLSVLIDDALAKNDPRVTLSLYTAPVEDDPFLVSTIKKANPALGDFLNKKEVRAMAEDAKRMPSRESEYRNLVLNQRVEIRKSFVSPATWQQCGGAVDETWGNAPIYVGLDLSTANDLTALVMIANINGKWQAKPTFWLPEEGIKERSRADHAQYDVWAKQGFLKLTPGKTVSYEYVAHQMFSTLIGLNIKKIGFDRWNFGNLRPWLVKAGFSDKYIDEIFSPFGQGYQSMSPALLALEQMTLSGKLAHGMHPVLTMCAGQAVVVSDPAGNRKLNKAKSHGRIDGMVALAMAAGLSQATTAEKQKVYQMMIV